MDTFHASGAESVVAKVVLGNLIVRLARIEAAVTRRPAQFCMRELRADCMTTVGNVGIRHTGLGSLDEAELKAEALQLLSDLFDGIRLG